MKIHVYGAVPEQPNRGVEALAEGSRAVLLRAFPEADVRFRSTGASDEGPVNLSHTSALIKAMFSPTRALRHWTRSFDMGRNKCGGDRSTGIHTVKCLHKPSAFLLYARTQGHSLMMAPQTIEPFKHRRSRLFAATFPKARTVLVSASEVVRARMQACLNAPSVGVPAMPMAYSREFAPLLDGLGWSRSVDVKRSGDVIARSALRHIEETVPEEVMPVLDEAHRRVESVVETLREPALATR